MMSNAADLVKGNNSIFDLTSLPLYMFMLTFLVQEIKDDVFVLNLIISTLLP